MRRLLEQKYGKGFLKRANFIADSLSQTPNWKRDVEFPGGQSALFDFLYSRLIKESIKIDSKPTPTRMYIQFEIDSNGKVVNPQVKRGVNEDVDKRVLKVINQMPNWKPGYLYGRPIKMVWSMPIFIKN
ncbi:MAG: hypothetical protein VB110_08505 [Bacteroidales bacterium]|nr:hypothetical protein [Bacteroidales bacterium]